MWLLSALNTKLFLIALVAFISTANITLVTAQENGQPQVQSNGGLTATLNGDRFINGDTISLNGCVKEGNTDSSVMIQVVDPNNDFVEISSVPVTEDKTFTYSIEAGANRSDLLHPMTVGGNYRMTVGYLSPDSGRESIEFAFAYNTTRNPAQDAGQQPNSTKLSSYSDSNDRTNISSSSANICSEKKSMFTDQDTGFAANLPQGWIVDDFDSTEYPNAISTPIAKFCPESAILSNLLESEPQCNYIDYTVDVTRYNQLDKDLGISSAQDEITSEQFMAYELQLLHPQFGSFDILSHESVPVNISSINNNGQQINKTADGTLISLNYSGVANPEGFFGYRLYFVDGTYGYVMSYDKRLSQNDTKIDRSSLESLVPEPVKQLMESVSLQSPITTSQMTTTSDLVNQTQQSEEKIASLLGNEPDRINDPQWRQVATDILSTENMDNALLVIHSTTGWSAVVQDSNYVSQSIDGFGSKSIEVECDPSGIFSIVVQKDTDYGVLDIYMAQNGHILKQGGTGASYGVVSIAGNCEG